MIPYIPCGWGGRKFLHLDITTIQIKSSFNNTVIFSFFFILFFFCLSLCRQKAYIVHATARIRK